MSLSSHARRPPRRHGSSRQEAEATVQTCFCTWGKSVGLGSRTSAQCFSRSESSLGQGSSSVSVPKWPCPSSCQGSMKAEYTWDQHRHEGSSHIQTGNICSCLSPSSKSYSSLSLIEHCASAMKLSINPIGLLSNLSASNHALHSGIILHCQLC